MYDVSLSRLIMIPPLLGSEGPLPFKILKNSLGKEDSEVPVIKMSVASEVSSVGRQKDTFEFKEGEKLSELVPPYPSTC